MDKRERERERCTYIPLHIDGSKKESTKEQRLQEKEEDREEGEAKNTE